LIFKLGKWLFELNIIVDVVGQYVLNGSGERRRRISGLWRAEDRRQRTEDRRQRTEDRRQKTEDRGQKTEDRRQRTEDRGQKTEGGVISELAN